MFAAIAPKKFWKKFIYAQRERLELRMHIFNSSRAPYWCNRLVWLYIVVYNNTNYTRGSAHHQKLREMLWKSILFD